MWKGTGAEFEAEPGHDEDEAEREHRLVDRARGDGL